MAKVERVRVRIVGDETREVKSRSVRPYPWIDLVSTLAFSVRLEAKWRILSREMT